MELFLGLIAMIIVSSAIAIALTLLMVAHNAAIEDRKKQP